MQLIAIPVVRQLQNASKLRRQADFGAIGSEFCITECIFIPFSRRGDNSEALWYRSTRRGKLQYDGSQTDSVRARQCTFLSRLAASILAYEQASYGSLICFANGYTLLYVETLLILNWGQD